MKWALNTRLMMMYWKQDRPITLGPARVSVVTAGHLHVGWWRGSVSRPPLCVLHIKSFMEAIKCVLNGQELAE